MHVLARSTFAGSLLSDATSVPVGAARLLISDDPDAAGEKYGKIGRVCVLKDHRGRGVGKAIVRQGVEEIRKLGCHVAKVGAQKDKLAFYEALGFVKDPKGGPEHGPLSMNSRTEHVDHCHSIARCLSFCQRSAGMLPAAPWHC